MGLSFNQIRSQDKLYHNLFISEKMSRERFLEILYNIDLSDPS